MENNTRSLREENMRDWSGIYGRQISEYEYDEISGNLRGFFEVLHRWDKE